MTTPRPSRAARALSETPPTASRILDEAERLAQTRGYNGFSYADVATVVGTTKAALHYHFPSKAELGRALVDRYTERFLAALDAIEARGSDAQCAARVLRPKRGVAGGPPGIRPPCGHAALRRSGPRLGAGADGGAGGRHAAGAGLWRHEALRLRGGVPDP